MASRWDTKKSDTSESATKKAKNAKKSWVQVAVMVVKRIFKWFRQLLSILYEILQEVLNTTVYLFSIGLKFISAPSTPCLLAISVFGVVMIITAGQWWQLGVWLGRLIGIGGIFNSFLSVGTGAAGMFLGLCLNIFQLSSEMWKISRRFAEYYAEKSVNTEKDTSEDKSVKARLGDWLSYDHSNLKKFRKMSYLLETGLMIAYTLLANMNFWGLVLGAMALTLPEITIKFVSSTITLLGGVSEHESEKPQDEYQF